MEQHTRAEIFPADGVRQDLEVSMSRPMMRGAIPVAPGGFCHHSANHIRVAGCHKEIATLRTDVGIGVSGGAACLGSALSTIWHMERNGRA